MVLLELLREAHERALVHARTERRRGEHDDAPPQVLVLAVLERELHDRERCGEVRGAADFGGGRVQGGEDSAVVIKCYWK